MVRVAPSAVPVEGAYHKDRPLVVMTVKEKLIGQKGPMTPTFKHIWEELPAVNLQCSFPSRRLLVQRDFEDAQVVLLTRAMIPRRSDCPLRGPWSDHG